MSSDQSPKKLPSDVFSDAVNQILNELEASLRASLPATAAEIAVVIMRLTGAAMLVAPLFLLLILEGVAPFIKALFQPLLWVAQAMFGALFSSKPDIRG